MDIQIENISKLNLAKDSRRQQPKGKGMKSSILLIEQQTSYEELNLQRLLRIIKGMTRMTTAKWLPSKLIAGILGVFCLVLLYTVVRMIHFIPTIVIPEQSNSPPITRIEKAHHCGHCPKEWFAYSNNCYYISNERKTWTESEITCASKDANLLLIDNEEEEQFLSSISPVSWIGVFRNSSDHQWMLINGSPFKLKITESLSVNDDCAVLSLSGLQSSVCGSPKMYLCKRKV
uniref:C-type lectin domain-containing protein n=1 Tax=Rhinolophus ferrumequinum TaxID=59479 RepID=A0A671F4S3_RHIFE